MSGMRLTANQRLQLDALRAAGAISRETGAGPWSESLTMCTPLVMGKLRDRQLVDSRVVRQPGGSQWTEYWLTPAGLSLAREAENASA